MSEKEQATAAVLRAMAELEHALSRLEKMPAIDPGAVAFSVHALNNYLTVNSCTVELLLLSLASHPDPQTKRWLDGLAHVNELMRHTANQIMNSSAPQDVKLTFLKWELCPLVVRACNYYQAMANRKNISIIFDPPSAIRPVWTDPVAAAVVLDNLLSNAVKYSPHGKKIYVHVREEDTRVVCSVCDDGPGLSEEDQTKLFLRGTKLSSMPTGKESSNGYGLAVAKELIDKLGGDLWCESVLGKGTCFSFRLPAYREHQ